MHTEQSVVGTVLFGPSTWTRPPPALRSSFAIFRLIAEAAIFNSRAASNERRRAILTEQCNCCYAPFASPATLIGARATSVAHVTVSW